MASEPVVCKVCGRPSPLPPIFDPYICEACHKATTRVVP